ncbi:FliO/MopB family protein [Natranaerobius trueperi]|uniref:Flagellar protein n=1 Tax=Natranaerobius trueperi TaxID=759412 RepID=A0A226BZ93_9FIRM|nr:flagellar biosynthetic protein FliO [Natranaerobius trueperi]OWZ84241.1 hypothetical protein CDO51_04070 [Natranaerobius trueperi]
MIDTFNLLSSNLKAEDANTLGGNTEQFTYLLTYLVGFIVVIGLLFLVLKLLKWYSFNLNEGKHMRVLDSLPLDNEKKLVLVEVGDKILLIGAGKELNLLTNVELDQDELQLIKESSSQISKGSLASVWQKIQTKFRNQFNKNDDSADTEIFEQQLQEELNKLRRTKNRGGDGNGEDK